METCPAIKVLLSPWVMLACVLRAPIAMENDSLLEVLSGYMLPSTLCQSSLMSFFCLSATQRCVGNTNPSR